jgi:hypothetical protein
LIWSWKRLAVNPSGTPRRYPPFFVRNLDGIPIENQIGHDILLCRRSGAPIRRGQVGPEKIDPRSGSFAIGAVDENLIVEDSDGLG